MEYQIIDEKLYLRQLITYGHEVQYKIMSMRVFVHGISGLGLEIAKNLILTGFMQVTLYDNKNITIQDLGRNYFVGEGDIGINRAKASSKKLRQLNDHAKVNIAEQDDIEFIVTNYNCVVILDNYDKKYLIQLDKACRDNNVGVIIGGGLGLYGYTFVDFGQHHQVTDQTGQSNKMIHIQKITKQKNATIYFFDFKKHQFSDGDIITFMDVEGMTEINGKQYSIKVNSPYSIIIQQDTTKFGQYRNGGIAMQVKKPIYIKFKSFEDSLKCPYKSNMNNSQGVSEDLHVILLAIYRYFELYKKIPRPLNQEDAQQLIKLVNQQFTYQRENGLKLQNIDNNLIKNVSKYAFAQLSPISSYWGGIISTQVIKKTGKYTPIQQWFHHHFFQALPANPNIKRSLLNNRYHDYAAVFGDYFVKESGTLNVLLAGNGALGCEYIKIFSLMGLSVQKDSKIYCVDDDIVKLGNITSQFLFRKQHIGKSKSQIACQQGRKINADVNFYKCKMRFGEESQQFFNQDFWKNLSFIVNAVDNYKSRSYIDSKSVMYQRPIFESGIDKTKGHSQVIIPHKTLSYEDFQDPPQQHFDQSTIKNFPFLIQHVIQSAQNQFQQRFVKKSVILYQFYEHKDKFFKKLKLESDYYRLHNELLDLQILCIAKQTNNFLACIELAVDMFQENFYKRIVSILQIFPEDKLTEAGRYFWRGLKKTPMPLKFNIQDPLHLQFIYATANIYAFMFGINQQYNKKIVVDLASQIKQTQFQELRNQKRYYIYKSKEIEEIEEIEIKIQIEHILQRLDKMKLKSSLKERIIIFKREDPLDFHIQFIASYTNLRARNHKISQVNNFYVQLVVGKIIPSIINSSAMLAGVTTMEIIKFILKKQIGCFKNTTINLALPFCVISDLSPPIINTDKEFDPIMCGPVKCLPNQFTKWEKIQIQQPIMTVEQLKNYMQKTYAFKVYMISVGKCILYSQFEKKKQLYMKMNLRTAIEQLTKKQISKRQRVIFVNVGGENQDGIDCYLPQVKIYINH